MARGMTESRSVCDPADCPDAGIHFKNLAAARPILYTPLPTRSSIERNDGPELLVRGGRVRGRRLFVHVDLEDNAP